MTGITTHGLNVCFLTFEQYKCIPKNNDKLLAKKKNTAFTEKNENLVSNKHNYTDI